MSERTTRKAPSPIPQDVPASAPASQVRPVPAQSTDPWCLRGLKHPQELALRGIPVMCPACGARRDWLLINQGRHVWIRCRCSHEWLEPEITRTDYDAMVCAPDGATYASVAEGLLALGYDGSFAGSYLG